MTNLFEIYLPPIFEGMSKRKDQLIEPIPTVRNNQVWSILRFMDSIIGQGSGFPFPSLEGETLKRSL